MAIYPNSTSNLSELLQYFSDKSSEGDIQIPSLPVLSKKLKISVASLREQLEVARILGFVEVRPRTGIRLLPYSFTPSLLISISYALSISSNYFEQFRDLRNHLESAYFLESIGKLSRNDIDRLGKVVEKAEEKISSEPPQLPHLEHREFHALLFSKVENTFAQSIFHVYWDVYEYQGFAVINDLDYLKRVWHYHRLVLEGIQSGNFNYAMDVFLEHKDLMVRSNKYIPKINFE